MVSDLASRSLLEILWGADDPISADRFAVFQLKPTNPESKCSVHFVKAFDS